MGLGLGPALPTPSASTCSTVPYPPNRLRPHPPQPLCRPSAAALDPKPAKGTARRPLSPTPTPPLHNADARRQTHTSQPSPPGPTAKEAPPLSGVGATNPHSHCFARFPLRPSSLLSILVLLLLFFLPLSFSRLNLDPAESGKSIYLRPNERPLTLPLVRGCRPTPSVPDPSHPSRLPLTAASTTLDEGSAVLHDHWLLTTAPCTEYQRCCLGTGGNPPRSPPLLTACRRLAPRPR